MAFTPTLGFNVTLIAAGNAAGALSSVVELENIDRYNVQAVWSAGSSLAGTITVSGSNDGITYTAVTTEAVSTNSGSWMYNNWADYAWLQVSWSNSAGTGTLNVTVNGKVL